MFLQANATWCVNHFAEHVPGGIQPQTVTSTNFGWISWKPVNETTTLNLTFFFILTWKYSIEIYKTKVRFQVNGQNTHCWLQYIYNLQTIVVASINRRKSFEIASYLQAARSKGPQNFIIHARRYLANNRFRLAKAMIVIVRWLLSEKGTWYNHVSCNKTGSQASNGCDLSV